MTTRYNRIANRSVERIAALSDGLFAIAMTLLVLDLRVPASEVVHSEQELWRALGALAPQLTTYFMSFLTLGIFWAGQQTQLNYFSSANRDLAWIHLAFLAAVSLMPFSTSLLAAFIGYRTALLIYWGNVLVLGLALYGSWIYATQAGLVKKDITPEVATAIKRRILIAQALYAFGASLCYFAPLWSIAFIVLVQLNYAIAARLPAHLRR